LKLKITLYLVFAVFVIVPGVFAQPMGQDPLSTKALFRFQNALKQDGFDVSYGRAEAWNPTADWCDGIIDSAQGVNNEPYLQVLVPKSAQDRGYPGLTQDFQPRQDEAIVV